MGKATKKMIQETKNKYFREYRKKNKERIKNINEKYWQKKALKDLV